LKITLLEAFGGIAWLALVRHEQPQLGGLILLVGLSIEHVVQGAKIKVDLAAPFEERAAAAAQKKAASPPAADGAAPPGGDAASAGTADTGMESE